MESVSCFQFGPVTFYRQINLGDTVKKQTHKVEFNAHKTVKRPTTVSFSTKQGERVRFTAEKPKQVPVHVKFRAKDKN